LIFEGTSVRCAAGFSVRVNNDGLAARGRRSGYGHGAGSGVHVGQREIGSGYVDDDVVAIIAADGYGFGESGEGVRPCGAGSGERGAGYGGGEIGNKRRTVPDFRLFGAEERGGERIQVTGRGPLAILDDAVVMEEAGNSTRTFSEQATVATLKTLIDEAQARGCFPILAYDFTAAVDSNSVAWSDSEVLEFAIGTSLLEVVRTIAGLGIDFTIDIETDGTFTLHAYSTNVGTDKSETIFLRIGTNCREVSQQNKGASIKNAITAKYGSGVVTVTDSTSISSYRRREKLYTVEQAAQLSTALSFANVELTNAKDPRVSIKVDVYDGLTPYAFVNYTIGDTVTLDRQGSEVTYRLKGMQLRYAQDDGFASTTVTLNDTFYEYQIESARTTSRLYARLSRAKAADKLDVSTWAYLTHNCDGQIYALYLEGTVLYIGGNFTTIGTITEANGFAMVDLITGVWSTFTGTYNGLTYSSGASSGECYAITGNGTGVIYFTGIFDNAGDVACLSIAKLTVATGIVSAMSTGLDNGGATRGYGYALAIDSLGKLWVGGEFDTAGGVATESIATWDGSWAGDPDDLIAIGFSRQVWALAIDSSNNVYAGGNFTTAGGAAKFNRIAVFNATSLLWEGLGSGISSGIVYALAVNSSNQVYVGGTFTNVDSIAEADRVALWSGAAWSALGTGFSAGTVYALHIDAYGNLYLGGDSLSTINGITINNLARYVGGSWYSVGYAPQQGAGDPGDITALETSPTGDLYIGGYFYRAGNLEEDASTPGLHIAALLTTFQSVINNINAGSGSYHAPVTIGTANGLSITDNQVLSMALASVGVTGTFSAPLTAALGGTGIANGASASLTLPNLAITLGGGGAAQTYTLPAVGGTFALLNAANEFTTLQFINGSADAIQLRVQGHSTQTNPVLQIETSAAAANFMVFPTGRVRMGLSNYSNTTDILHVAENQSHSSGNRNLIYSETVYATQTGGSGSIFGFSNNILINALTGGNPTSGSYSSVFSAFVMNNIPAGRSIPSGVTSIVNRARGYTSASMAGTVNNLAIFGSDLWGLQSNPAGVVTNIYGLFFSALGATSSGGGSITNAYGIKIGDIAGATSLNYAIYTDAGQIRFGDTLNVAKNVIVVGASDVNQLKITGHTTQTLPVGYLIDNTATTNAVRNVLQLETQSTGTAAAGLGAGLLYTLETATGGTNQTAGVISASWVDATNATRKAKLSLSAYDTAERLGMEITAGGSQSMVTIGGATASARLTLPAGGTASNTSPLKFTTQASGLTNVEQGAMELIGNSLQFTQLAKRRGVAMTQSVRTSSTTVENTITESAALVTAEHGANYLEVGKMEEIVLVGTLEQRSNPAATMTFTIKYAGSSVHTIVTSANNVIAAGSPFVLRLYCTVRSVGGTGTMQINSWLEVPGETTKGGSTLATIDTTTAQNTTITATWGEANAANILVVQQARVLCIETNK